MPVLEAMRTALIPEIDKYFGENAKVFEPFAGTRFVRGTYYINKTRESMGNIMMSSNLHIILAGTRGKVQEERKSVKETMAAQLFWQPMESCQTPNQKSTPHCLASL